MTDACAIFTSTSSRSASTNSSLLILEDGEQSGMVCRLLSPEGAEMMSQITEEEAVEVLTSLAPRLLLADISVPASSRQVLVDQLTAGPFTNKVLVILASGLRAVEIAMRVGRLPTSVLSTMLG